MKKDRIYKKVLFLCTSFILCVILAALLFFFNKDIPIMVNYALSSISYSINNNNNNTLKKSFPTETKEIHISALGEIFNGEKLKPTLEDEDFLFIPNLAKVENISTLKEKLKSSSVNLIMGDIDETQTDAFSPKLVASKNMISSDFSGNKISYLYYNGDFNFNDLSVLINNIRTLKKENFSVVLSLKNYHSQQFLYLFANLGVNLIFTDSNSSLKFERYENTLIVYNLNNNSKDYIPNFNFIFSDNAAMALGIKVTLLSENKTTLLEEINKNSKGFLFEIKDSYNFINY